VTEVQSYASGKKLIMIQWDSLSLKQTTAATIRRSEKEGLDWMAMGLYPGDIEHAEPGDTQQEVEAYVKELSVEHAWDDFGKQGQRICQVLRNVDEDDDMAAFKAWQEYLKAHLKLPFKAVVSEHQERGPLQTGDQVTVTDFQEVDDLYGIFVGVVAGYKTYVFPLCDLEAVNPKSPQHTLTDDYAVWFANR